MEKAISITGDTFVDNGALAQNYLKKALKQNDTQKLIDTACEIYVDRWGSKIDALFLNAKVTQNIFKSPQKKKEKTKEFYQSLNDPSQAAATGFCRTCGKHSPLYSAGRDVFCLTGSGKFTNFHHGHEPGLMLCQDCLTTLFFLPFSVLQMGKRLALLQINSPVIREYWEKKTVQANVRDIGNNISEGILKSRFANPKNALFNLAKEIIGSYQDDPKTQFLELYYFTNFGASPECEIYRLPSPVFSFLKVVLSYYKPDWYNFVRPFYRIANSAYMDETESWRKNTKNGQDLEESDYLNNPNLIYERLLAGQSIIGLFAGYSRKRYNKGLPGIRIPIVRVYLKEVIQMENERINVLKRITDTIFEMAKEDDDVKKYLLKIHGPKNAYELRNALVWMIKRHFQLHPDAEALLPLDDYLNYLFPPGQYWSEIRDLMLIYFYQRLHEEGIWMEEIDDDNDQ